MTGKKASIIDLHLLPLPGRSLRWVPWAAYVGAGVGYLSGVLSTPYPSLLSLFLLTGTYGAWVVIVLIGLRRVAVVFHPGWVLALFCLACASQFIPLPGTDTDWLPLLPVMTTGALAAIRPRALGLLATGVLCLSSYLAIRRLVPVWGIGSQVGLLLSFASTFVFWAIIRALAVSPRGAGGLQRRLSRGQRAPGDGEQADDQGPGALRGGQEAGRADRRLHLRGLRLDVAGRAADLQRPQRGAR